MVEAQARPGLTFCCRYYCSRTYRKNRESKAARSHLVYLCLRFSNANYGAAQVSANQTAKGVLDSSLHRCQLSLCMLLMPQHAQSCHALCCCIQLLSIMILILMVRLFLPALHSCLQINTNKTGNRIKGMSCITKHYIWIACCYRWNMTPQRSVTHRGAYYTTSSRLYSTHIKQHYPSWYYMMEVCNLAKAHHAEQMNQAFAMCSRRQ